MENKALTGEERRARVAIIEELLLHGADPGVGDSDVCFSIVISVCNDRGSRAPEGYQN